MVNNLIIAEINQQRTAIVNKKGANQVKKGQVKVVRKKLEAIAPNKEYKKRVRQVKQSIELVIKVQC